MHKRGTKGSSGRNPAFDHARRANTLLAMHRLMTPDPYQATKFSYKQKKHVTTAVTGGPGCQRALTFLAGSLRGGISNVVDAEVEAKPTASQSTGQVRGSAMWKTTVRRSSDASSPSIGGGAAAEEEASNDGWQDCVRGEHGIRPHANTILKAA